MAPATQHPVHPGLVHFPLAFLLTSQLTDIVYFLSTHPLTAPHVARVYPVAVHATDLARLSHLLLALGVLAAIPAILSGAYELLQLQSRVALASKLKRASGAKETAAAIPQKVQIAFLHAGIVDLVVASSAYNWWDRSFKPAAAPEQVNLIIAVNGLLFLGFGAWLGGQLVYKHGVGVYAAGALKKDE